MILFCYTHFALISGADLKTVDLANDDPAHIYTAAPLRDWFLEV